MKEGDKFYKIEALISKVDIDEKLKELNSQFSHKANIVFNALENNGIKVYEISIHSASARIQEKHITLDVSGNGESTNRKGFKRHEIDY